MDYYRAYSPPHAVHHCLSSAVLTRASTLRSSHPLWNASAHNEGAVHQYSPIRTKYQLLLPPAFLLSYSVFSPHGIAMTNGLYFTAVVSFFFLISEVTERISTKLGHIFTCDWYLKNLVRTPPGIYPPRAGRDRLWTLTKRNTITTIGKKFVNWRVFAYPPLSPPKFSHWETLGCTLATGVTGLR